MKSVMRALAATLCAGLITVSLTACGSAADAGKRIIRVGHNQATDHPTNIALLYVCMDGTLRCISSNK